MVPFFATQEGMEDEVGDDWLFSSEEEVMEDPEPEEPSPFRCVHDREEFAEIEDFLAHNKEFHKGFKKKCKFCQNMFRDVKRSRHMRRNSTKMRSWHASMTVVHSPKLTGFTSIIMLATRSLGRHSYPYMCTVLFDERPCP
ncbi:conserved hypothetical protein [Ricinus communis]|uniref:Uncharacterized protein n=1 Tax=Ricinus communis TaxID=3988 RepID=B9SY38_RICCO|nr:conserved hypothetical protein [Ricinus communis]